MKWTPYVALAVAFWGIVFVSFREPVHMALADLRNESLWRTTIGILGPHTAYAHMLSQVAHTNASDAHSVAHVFGRVLYGERGMAGLSVCGEEYLYGCMHEFVGQAIADKGLSIVHDINTFCAQNMQCQHAVGHGLLGYFGYSTSSIVEAIALCEGLEGSSMFSGCGSGVFMEYSFRSLVGEGSMLRTLGKDIYEPCGLFRGVAAETCLFWQPQIIWENWRSEEPDVHVLFTKLGDVCARAADRHACVAGLGRTAVSAADYDRVLVEELCLDATETDAEHVLCRAYAGQVLIGTISEEEGHRMCEGLSPELKDVCLAQLNSSRLPSEFEPFSRPVTKK